MALLSRIRSWLALDERGVGAVEFATIIPVALTLYLGASYTSFTASINKKMQTAAYDMIDMVPYPRNYCTYKAFVSQAFTSGFQRNVVSQMLSPFPVTDTNPTIQFVESQPDSQNLISVVAKIRYTPDSGIFRLYNQLTGQFANVAGLKGGLIGADSPAVTVMQNTVCPQSNYNQISIIYNGAVVNDKTTPIKRMAGDSINVPYSVTGGLPLLSNASPYRISTTQTMPPGVNFAANGTNPYYQGVSPETAPGTSISQYTATMTVSDYASYVFPTSDQVARTSVAFSIVHKLTLTGWPSQTIQMGSSTPYRSPTPSAQGGDSTGYTFSMSGLPTDLGLTIDPGTGIVTGNANRPGVWMVTLAVRDAMGNVATVSPVQFQVLPVPLVLNVPTSITVVGRQSVSSAFNAQGGYGPITVTVCMDKVKGRMPLTWSCGASPAANYISGSIQGQANELGSGTITVTVQDQSSPTVQTITKTIPYSVAQPQLFAYTDAPGGITATYGQAVSLRLHTYGGWGNSGIISASNVCCGLAFSDLGSANPESDHPFLVSGTINALTGPRTITVTFQDSAGSQAVTTFTLNVPNTAMSAWSDGNIVTTAGWCGQMPWFHSSGGNGSRVVAGYWGQPPGFSPAGDANNFYFSGCSSPGAGTITWVVQDAVGQQASATQYWQFNAPALSAWNDGNIVGTAGQYYSYPAFHSAGGWGARNAIAVRGNPPGPNGNGNGDSWWLTGSTAPGAGYTTLTFGDSVGQRAESTQYWQMNLQPLSCWNDGSAVNYAGNFYNFPAFHSGGGYGQHYAISFYGGPSGMYGNGDGYTWWLAGVPAPGEGTGVLTFRDDAGQQCTAYQYWRMMAPPLYAWNDGSAINTAGPYYNLPTFHSSGGYGGRYFAAVYGNPGWAYGSGDVNNYWLSGNSQPGEGVTTVVYADQAGQQAATQQYWSFSQPPIYFSVDGAPNLTYYDGYVAQWINYFHFYGGYGYISIVNWAIQVNQWYYPISFGIGGDNGNTGHIVWATTPYSATVSTIYVQVCDQLGNCPTFAFQLNCNSHMCHAG
jgi:hypothetical protein